MNDIDSDGNDDYNNDIIIAKTNNNNAIDRIIKVMAKIITKIMIAKIITAMRTRQAWDFSIHIMFSHNIF